MKEDLGVWRGKLQLWRWDNQSEQEEIKREIGEQEIKMSNLRRDIEDLD